MRPEIQAAILSNLNAVEDLIQMIEMGDSTRVRTQEMRQHTRAIRTFVTGVQTVQPEVEATAAVVAEDQG